MVLLFVGGALATILFGGSGPGPSGSCWDCLRHEEQLAPLRDSLLAVLADTVDVVSACVGEGGTLGGLLFETGVQGSRYTESCRLLIDSLGWTSVHVGDTLEAWFVRDTLAEVRGRPRSARGYYSVVFDGDGSPTEWSWVPSDRWTRMRAVVLEVDTSVWEAIASGALPSDLTPTGSVVTYRDSVREVAYVKELEDELANRLFAYDIDFYHDVQPGDRIWLLLEETRFPVSDETSFRRILAAKYVFALGGITEALPYYHMPDTILNGETTAILDHYHRDGASLRTMFLRMPVPFGRVSSPYSDARMHPVLGYTRAHRGVDYAAPMGTEIFAVGDGVITQRGWHGGYGNIVRVRHSNGYETGYGHMSSFASGQEIGTYVRQGEVIGYVGSTGLSTGPHLHFEMKRSGSYVNPANEIVPPADPLEGEELADFREQLPVLEAWWSSLSPEPLPEPQPTETAASESGGQEVEPAEG